MNKQRFIAELTQLLSFMEEHDRAEFLRQLNERFDEAGPEGKAELISRLGTPTAMAIKASHEYTPTPPPEPAQEEEPAAQEAAEETDKAGEAEKTQAEEDAPDAEEDSRAEPEPEPGKAEAADGETETDAEEAQAGQAAAEALEEEKPTLSDLFGGQGAEAPVPPVQEEKKDRRARRSLVTLTIFGGIMLLCLLLALCAVVISPGLCAVGGAVFAFLAGLWASPVFTDALFLFGIAAIALAVGLLLLFLAVWLMKVIVKPLVSGTAELFRLTGGEDK